MFAEEKNSNVTPKKSKSNSKLNIRIMYAAVLLAGLIAVISLVFVFGPNLIKSLGISEEEYFRTRHNSKWEYYGKYGSCFASLPEGESGKASSETVGGLTFEYDTDTSMKVFHKYKFYTFLQLC